MTFFLQLPAKNISEQTVPNINKLIFMMEKKEEIIEGVDYQEVIDIEKCTQEGKRPDEGKWYRVRIEDTYYIFLKQHVTATELMKKACIDEVTCFWLYRKLKGCDFERIDLSERVNLAEPGIEHFIIKPTEVFHYFLDGEPETTDQKQLTPNQILTLGGVIPVKDYYLVRINADGTQEKFDHTPNIPIKMVCPSVKFVSVFRGETPVS